jgi:biopolymer transport protein ExbD
MAIRFRCSTCNQLMSIAGRMAGRKVRCPACDAELTVPLQDQLEAAAPAAAAAGAAEPPAASRAVELDLGQDQGFHVRKPSTEFEDMDLTPMVDVVFLLLIFFMITASFSITKTIEIPQPDPEQQGARQTIQSIDDLQSKSVWVRIDQRNDIYVDDELLADRSSLTDLLREQMRNERKTEMVIQVDPRALWESTVLVKDAGTGAGMQRIRLATVREAD